MTTAAETARHAIHKNPFGIPIERIYHKADESQIRNMHRHLPEILQKKIAPPPQPVGAFNDKGQKQHGCQDPDVGRRVLPRIVQQAVEGAQAEQNAREAERMTPPEPYRQLHPHFLLVLENVERSFHFAAKGQLAGYRRHQKIVRKELNLLEALAERAAEVVTDEFPEVTDEVTGVTTGDSAMQTNNPGYPGYESGGLILTLGPALSVPF